MKILDSYKWISTYTKKLCVMILVVCVIGAFQKQDSDLPISTLTL